MRKILTLIILALLCLTANATDLSVAKKKKKKVQQTVQADPVIITQTVWGCTVGTSTLRQVQDSLADRGLTVDKGEGFLTVTKGDMRFGGIHWASVRFLFSEGRLMDIRFESPAYESYNAAASAYDALISKLNVKYKAQRDSTAKNANYEKYDIYRDTYTRITPSMKQQQVTRTFTLLLNYTNLKLLGTFGKEDINEL